MALTLGMITIDSTDPARSRSGGPNRPAASSSRRTTAGSTWWASPAGHKLGFQKVDDPTPGKNRQHMDLSSPDLDAEVERLVVAGASEVHRENMDGFRWVVLADPQGNQFCVSGAH